MLSLGRTRAILALALAAAILDGLVVWIVPQAIGPAAAFASIAVISFGRGWYPPSAHERVVLVQVVGLAVVTAIAPLWVFRRRAPK